MKAVLKNKLKIYSSLAAMPVAGVVNAQIVHTPINFTGGCDDYYLVDMDSDGYEEFRIESYCFATSYTLSSGMLKRRDRNLSIYGNYYGSWGSRGNSGPTPYSAGALIDSNLSFVYNFWQGYLEKKSRTWWQSCSTCASMSISYGVLKGEFGDGSEKYIGVRFAIDDVATSGEWYYGWIRMKDVLSVYNPLTGQLDVSWTIVDMAYESTPNTPILAGAMFLAPPPATNPTALVSGGSINLTFDASAGEEAISEYRLFVVKEGVAFGLTEAEANNNYTTITPDGSSDYAHAFNSGTTDSDGNTVLRTTPILDASGEALAANQNYSIYVLNMAKTPFASENSLSTPSNIFTVSSSLSAQNVDWQNEVFVYPVPNNGTFKIKLQSGNSIEEIKLFDVTGKLVEDLSSKQNETMLEVTNLMRGSYVLHVKSAKSSKAYKIIVM